MPLGRVAVCLLAAGPRRGLVPAARRRPRVCEARGRADRLRHRAPQPRPRLDRLRDRLRRAEGAPRRRSRYVPVRLGEVNAQTRWALERSGVPEPELLRHIHLRARDVMRPECHCADQRCVAARRRARDGGRGRRPRPDHRRRRRGGGRDTRPATSRGATSSESGEPSSFADRPVSADLIVNVLGGEMLVRRERRRQRARCGRWRSTPPTGQRPWGERHRRDRRPRRRPAAGDRARRGPAGHDQRARGPRTG